MITLKQIDIIKKFLNSRKINFSLDVNLKEYSYFKSGGTAKLIVSPKYENELTDILKFMYNNNFCYKVIGDTSNILFLDDENYGVFLSLKEFNKILHNESSNEVEVFSGVSLPFFS